MLEPILVLTTLAATWMAAVGWVMQLIHYPTFRRIPPDRFGDFHRQHTRALGILVGAPMIAEGMGAALLIGLAPSGPMQVLAVIGFALAMFAIVWTAVISGPIHMRMNGTFDEKRIEQLCQTNLPRSLAWLGHAVCCATMLVLG